MGSLSIEVLLGLIAAFLFGLGATVYLVRDPRGLYPLMVLMLFAAGLSVQVDRSHTRTNVTWLTALQERRGPMYIAVSAVTVLGLLIHFGKVRFNNVSGPAAWLVFFQCYIAMLRAFHDGAVVGFESLGFVAITMFPLLFLLPLTLNRLEDFHKLIRVLAWTALLWCGAVLVQVVINKEMLVTGYQKRFTGMLGNPQACTVYMVPMSMCVLWLVLNETSRVRRWIWIPLFGVLVVFSLWTGSRLAIVESAVGVVAVIYARAKRAALFLPVLIALSYGALEGARAIGLVSSDALDRAVSGENTRSASISFLIEDATKSPIFGTGFKETRAVENSYLLAFGAYGIPAGLMAIGIAWLSLRTVVQQTRLRRSLTPPFRSLSDLIIGFNLMFVVATMFEWVLVARLESMLPLYLAFGAMAKRLTDMASAEQRAVALGEYDPGEASGAEPVPA